LRESNHDDIILGVVAMRIAYSLRKVRERDKQRVLWLPMMIQWFGWLSKEEEKVLQSDALSRWGQRVGRRLFAGTLLLENPDWEHSLLTAFAIFDFWTSNDNFQQGLSPSP